MEPIFSSCRLIVNNVSWEKIVVCLVWIFRLSDYMVLSLFCDKREKKNTTLSEQVQQSNFKIVERGKMVTEYLCHK